MMQDLKEFVANTLTQIISGIGEAANSVKKSGHGRVVPYAKNSRGWNEQNIEFDVAVTAADQISGNAGGGIKVLGIGLNSEVKGQVENQSISRIKFTVPIGFTADDTEETKRLAAEQIEKVKRHNRALTEAD